MTARGVTRPSAAAGCSRITVSLAGVVAICYALVACGGVVRARGPRCVVRRRRLRRAFRVLRRSRRRALRPAVPVRVARVVVDVRREGAPGRHVRRRRSVRRAVSRPRRSARRPRGRGTPPGPIPTRRTGSPAPSSTGDSSIWSRPAARPPAAPGTTWPASTRGTRRRCRSSPRGMARSSDVHPASFFDHPADDSRHRAFASRRTTAARGHPSSGEATRTGGRDRRPDARRRRHAARRRRPDASRKRPGVPIRWSSVSTMPGAEVIRVASLEDVIKSKRAASRKKDLAVLPVLEETLREKKRQEG